MNREAVYKIQTFNDALESENRIHSDKIAEKFGFEGALVGGVVVFGHMTYQPVRLMGDSWLTDNQAEVRFIKPAYDQQFLNITCREKDSGHLELECLNDQNTLLATMESRKGATPFNSLWEVSPAKDAVIRREIHWDLLHIDQPAPVHIWNPSLDGNIAYSSQLKDDNLLYTEGSQPLVHPFWTSRECNSAFVRSFILPAWIHVGTKFYFHKPLRVGQSIEIRMIPTKKWESKGHQLATLYIAFIVDNEPYVEAEHTAIFRIAGS